MAEDIQVDEVTDPEWTRSSAKMTNARISRKDRIEMSETLTLSSNMTKIMVGMMDQAVKEFTRCPYCDMTSSDLSMNKNERHEVFLKPQSDPNKWESYSFCSKMDAAEKSLLVH